MRSNVIAKDDQGIGDEQRTGILLDVDDLSVHFKSSDAEWIPAVKGVSFQVSKKEILGIVGESGCGKSVTSFSILRLHDERVTRYGGSIEFDGRNIFDMKRRELAQLRGGDIGFIFQNPMSSLNPLMTIGQQLRETAKIHDRDLDKNQIHDRCIEALTDAGSDDPEGWMSRYPYQLSGGMLQRVVIGMALINHPKVLIADEPTTALDVTVQMQLLKVLQRLRDERGMSIVLITHDMGVVAQMCDRVAVMYLGQIVEEADTQELFAHPKHPYTRGLLAATPPLRGERPRRLTTIAGSVPQLVRVKNGCRFASRCPFAGDMCRSGDIRFLETNTGHMVRCRRVDEIDDLEKASR